MKDVEFIRVIENSMLGVFGIPDIARIINKERGYARLFAKRLQDRGLIIRVEKSKYILTGTDIEIVASNLAFPSYISFLSGLAYHRRTTQLPHTIQIATSMHKKDVDYENARITFISLKKERVFGYGRMRLRSGYAFVGEVEKVILDSLLLPRCCPISESYGAIRDGVNREKILLYAGKMGSKVLLKRLGYLLEQAGIDTYAELKQHITARYEPLNPYLPGGEKKDRKWRLRINEVI